MGAIWPLMLEETVPLTMGYDNLLHFNNWYFSQRIIHQGATFSANADGTFTVKDTISADGETAAGTAAIITGWVGEVKDGLTIDWLVEAASCN